MVAITSPLPRHDITMESWSKGYDIWKDHPSRSSIIPLVASTYSRPVSSVSHQHPASQ
jgi:hypothetical protein